MGKITGFLEYGRLEEPHEATDARKKHYREFYLRLQLKAIQTELGEGNELAEDIAAYREKMAKAKMPKPVEEEVDRQLKKLERMHPDAAETGTLRNWRYLGIGPRSIKAGRRVLYPESELARWEREGMTTTRRRRR